MSQPSHRTRTRTRTLAATGVVALTAFAAAAPVHASPASTAEQPAVAAQSLDLATPSQPGPSTEWVPSDITDTSINLRWTYPDDAPPVDHFTIVYDGLDAIETVTVPGTSRSKLLEGLGPASSYIFTITAYDAEGNPSSPYTTDELETMSRPWAPNYLEAGTPTTNSVTLTWTPSYDVDGEIVAYHVLRDGVKIATVDPIVTNVGVSTVVTGLASGTDYTFTIQAVDDEGLVSEPSRPVSVKTEEGPKPPVHLDYTLAGKTTLKTLTRGELKLSGAIAADFTLATGLFTADLALNDTSGRLVAINFLPVTAKVGFVPSGKTTGNLDQATNVLTTNTKVRIKVKEVKLFGAIPLAGGNNCQSKSLSDIVLKSAPGFQPLDGGKITGTYRISDLNGCGALNGLVSPLTAGAGNTIELGLTPKLP